MKKIMLILALLSTCAIGFAGGPEEIAGQTHRSEVIPHFTMQCVLGAGGITGESADLMRALNSIPPIRAKAARLILDPHVTQSWKSHHAFQAALEATAPDSAIRKAFQSEFSRVRTNGRIFIDAIFFVLNDSEGLMKSVFKATREGDCLGVGDYSAIRFTKIDVQTKIAEFLADLVRTEYLKVYSAIFGLNQATARYGVGQSMSDEVVDEPTAPLNALKTAASWQTLINAYNNSVQVRRGFA